MSESERQFQQDPDSPLNKQLIRTLKANDVFAKLPFSTKLIQEITKELVIVWVDSNKRIHMEEFEILLVLRGAVYQYVPNVWGQFKNNCNPDVVKRQLLLFRKIIKNDFYTSYHPKYAHNQSQLVAEAGSVIVKIPEHLFIKYFEKKLQHRMGQLINILRNFEFTKSFKVELLYELSKHLNEMIYSQGSMMYQKGMDSNYLYFIKSGTVELYERKYPKNEKKKYSLNTFLGKGKVVGLDGVITPTEGNKRLFTCEALTNVQLLAIQRRVLIILICSAKERDAIKAYRQINLAEQFQHAPRKSQLVLSRSKLKQTMSNFRPQRKSIVDQLKNQESVRLSFPNSPKQYQSRASCSSNYRAFSSQMLPPSRISYIQMGEEEDQQGDLLGSSPKFTIRRKSVTLLKSSSSTAQYRRQYSKQLQELVEVKRLQEKHAKSKVVSQSKLDEKMKFTKKVKRIFHYSKSRQPQQKVDIEDVLFKRLQDLNQNPLLLNFESRRKRMLGQIKNTLAK